VPTVRTSSASLRATIDTGNFLLVSQNPVNVARELEPRAAFVHLKALRAVGPDEQMEEIYTGLDGHRYSDSRLPGGHRQPAVSTG
jgi:sugar phosphate isomerase/epimerase